MKVIFFKYKFNRLISRITSPFIYVADYQHFEMNQLKQIKRCLPSILNLYFMFKR